MPICSYGRCTMVNLCKSDYCVRAEMEKQGWVIDKNKEMVRKEKSIEDKQGS